MEAIGKDIWIQPFELKALGVNFGRMVTVVRLGSGELAIHSTAPFTERDVAEINQLGVPRWIVDPMRDHDTFSSEGSAAFPQATFLAPKGFPKKPGLVARDVMPPPEEWSGELEVLPIEGAPGFSEHVFFHRPSRVLIVCDLLMNFPAEKESGWANLLLRMGLGAQRSPGTSRRLKLAIRDREAFRASVARVMELDFEQVVVGHGEPLRERAKERAGQAFRAAGWLD